MKVLQKRLAYLEEAITQESWQLQKKKTVMYLWGLEVQNGTGTEKNKIRKEHGIL